MAFEVNYDFYSSLQRFRWISSTPPPPGNRYLNCSKSGIAAPPDQNFGAAQFEFNNKTSILFYFSAAILLLVMGALAEGTDWCSSTNTYLFPLNQTSVQLHVQVPMDIVFIWDSVPSGNQLNVEASENIFISTQITAGNVTIKLKSTDSMATCSSGPLKVRFFLLWLAVACMVYVLTPLKSKTFWMVFVVGISISWTFALSNCNSPSVHLRFPMKLISEICINEDKCIPSTCDLGFFSLESDGYSKISASNKDFFEDNDCTLKKPAFWDEWVSYHFNFNNSDEEFYYVDSDNDGLVNILEYYSNGSTPERSTERVRRFAFSVATVGSNPLNPDSDGDLLLDGFEAFFGLSPTEADDSTADDDNDGLTNLQEQIYGSDPLNRDSDGDGVTDGIEVEKQGNPTDITDDGSRTATSKDFAMIKLTIGDPSGSNSERYNLHVGAISHQAPDFGVVGSGTYKFGPGRYAITVRWVATNLETPDYDYTAQVSRESGDATVTVEDPDNILGTFYDSYFDRTVGKEATLIVEGGECLDEASDEIHCIDTCDECQSSPFQKWNTLRDLCEQYIGFILPDSDCPCKQCEEWYHDELKNISWLEGLNSARPCPCQAKYNLIGLTSANENSVINWYYDWFCLRNSFPFCSKFHPGASGCMRADWQSHRQQCCYDSNLNWIQSGSPGAGTPDKARSVKSHFTEDVLPFKWCCKHCKDQKYCDYYIGQGGVRTGPTTCSNDA